MAPRDPDDEQELINAEFESMVSGLNLDQSSPRTYLDDLEEIDRANSEELYAPARIKRGLHGSITHLIESLKRWWKKQDSGDGDGAVV